jgi:hypothetical protein
LNARNELDNPSPNPKQPFSRQNGVGTIGGPLVKGKLWLFSSFEYVNEDASVGYSAQSLDEFDEEGAQAALDRLLAGFTVEAVLRDAVMPYLHALGEGWEQGKVFRYERWIDEPRRFRDTPEDVIDVAVVTIGPDEKIDRKEALRLIEETMNVIDEFDFSYAMSSSARSLFRQTIVPLLKEELRCALEIESFESVLRITDIFRGCMVLGWQNQVFSTDEKKVREDLPVAESLWRARTEHRPPIRPARTCGDPNAW